MIKSQFRLLDHATYKQLCKIIREVIQSTKCEIEEKTLSKEKTEQKETDEIFVETRPKNKKRWIKNIMKFNQLDGCRHHKSNLNQSPKMGKQALGISLIGVVYGHITL